MLPADFAACFFFRRASLESGADVALLFSEFARALINARALSAASFLSISESIDC